MVSLDDLIKWTEVVFNLSPLLAIIVGIAGSLKVWNKLREEHYYLGKLYEYSTEEVKLLNRLNENHREINDHLEAQVSYLNSQLARLDEEGSHD